MMQLEVDKSLKDSVVAAWRFSYNESTWNETSVYSSNHVRKTKLLPVVISGGPACHPDVVSKPPKGPPWGHFHGSGHHDGTPHRGSLHAHSQLHHAVTDTSLVLTATHPSGFSSCIVAFLWSFCQLQHVLEHPEQRIAWQIRADLHSVKPADCLDQLQAEPHSAAIGLAPAPATVYQLHTSYGDMYDAAVTMLAYHGEITVTLHLAASNAQLSNGGPPVYAYTFELTNGGCTSNPSLQVCP